MTSAFKWTPDLVDQVKSLYLSDIGPRTISARLGITEPVIVNLLMRLGIRRAKPTIWTEDRVAQLTELHGKGHSVVAIAGDLGLRPETVYNMVSRLGLSRRKGVPKVASPWTEQDYVVARQMHDANFCIDDIARRLSRTVYSVRSKLRERAAAETTTERAPPDAVLSQRARLNDARGRQDAIAHLMGDPPPGFSALDRMRSAST